MSAEIQPVLPATPEPRRVVPAAPIHPLAALTTIVLDNVFGVFEILDPLALALTSLTVGAAGFLSTLFVQRYLAKDEWGAAVAKGLVMGVLAGVPFQVTGTAVGVPLLAWAGLHRWIQLPPLRGKPGLPSAEEGEIVDVEPS
jgi:hypothetical protein